VDALDNWGDKEMNANYALQQELVYSPLLDRIRSGRLSPLSFSIETTARCTNNCRHCYVNLPAGDSDAKSKEMSLDFINHLADEAVSLGIIWCLVSGGEPLLRGDFADMYLSLKNKGLLVSVFTNATLITEEHVRLFRKYPPRDLEISVYGVTQETYEAVTRVPGSFFKFMNGVNSLLDNGIRIRFKTMALRSNFRELPKIGEFCREKTKDFFRFDPWLHLRYDGNARRNEEIQAERLTPEEFVTVEQQDEDRSSALENKSDSMLSSVVAPRQNHLFYCTAGRRSFTIGYDGVARPCSSLHHPDCVYDLRHGSLVDAYNNLFPKVLEMQSTRKEYNETCRVCRIVNFCMWCPAHSYLETGAMDTPIEYFCQVAHARAKAFGIVYDDADCRQESS
jgi:radical SAM protein with 4Fe4S-binding SPASM domain